jgi:integrase/recombinase XerD
MRKIADIAKSIFGLNKERDNYVIIDGILYENEQLKQNNEEKAIIDDEKSKKTAKIKTEISEYDIEKLQRRGRLPKIERFWNFLTASGKAKRTIQEYKYEFGWWTKKAEKLNKTLYTLKISDIESILKDIHPSTARRKISFLKTLSKWYLREGKNRLYVEVSKFISPKIPQRLPSDHGAKKFEEIKKLSKELCDKKERVGIWLGLMIICGLRISEIQTVSVKDDIFIKVLGKGNKERLVPIPLWLFEALNKIKKNSQRGWAKNRNIVYWHVKKLGFKPHSLRHTYASELLRRGKNIEEIRVLLGHADISTTSIYARINISADSALLLDS